jgi:LppX_LprAFG lipoprotein
MEAGDDHEVAADGEDLLMRRLALGGLVFALAVAGCGGGGGKQSAPKVVSGDLLAAAAVKSERAGSVEADFKVSGPSLKGSGSGVFNTGASRSGQLSATVTVGGMQVPIDTVITGNVLYMRSAVFSQLRLSGDKQWVKVDLAQLAQQRGIDLSSLANTSPTPTSALSYLRGSGKVEAVGRESIGGVETTHYKAIVDLRKAAANADEATREALRRAIQTSGVKKLPIDVWIDGKGLVRKVQYAQGVGSGRAVKVTMELHDYGKPVTVKPPPADSVFDLGKALGG